LRNILTRIGIAIGPSCNKGLIFKRKSYRLMAKRGEDVFQSTSHRTIQQAGLQPTKPENLPQQIDHFSHPDFFQDIRRLSCGGDLDDPDRLLGLRRKLTALPQKSPSRQAATAQLSRDAPAAAGVCFLRFWPFQSSPVQQYGGHAARFGDSDAFFLMCTICSSAQPLFFGFLDILLRRDRETYSRPIRRGTDKLDTSNF
jgi:hypothetical protein